MMRVDLATRRLLLALARDALEASVRRALAPPVSPEFDVEAFGVFVTIRHRGDLRGCLGALDCRDSIAVSIARLAAAVPREDVRFDPLTVQELPDTAIDLSLLTMPEPVLDVTHIEVGRHGLIVEQGRRHGLLLPQVAPEQGWDRETFLAQACVKAGLPAAAWRNGAQLFRFEADVFGE